MKLHIVTTLLLLASPGFYSAHAETVEDLIKIYTSNGAASPSAEQGKRLWQKTNNGKGDFAERSCATCHTTDLSRQGKHVKTNKIIRPMSPASNPERLTDARKVEKWFKRNCKWTFDRECTGQEKADFLSYINNSSRF